MGRSLQSRGLNLHDESNYLTHSDNIFKGAWAIINNKKKSTISKTTVNNNPAEFNNFFTNIAEQLLSNLNKVKAEHSKNF